MEPFGLISGSRKNGILFVVEVESYTPRRRKYSSERAENELRIVTFFAAKKRRGENESKQRALRLFQGEKQARGKKGWRKKMQIKGGCSDCKYVTVDPCNYTTVLRFNKPLAHALDL